MAAHEIKTRFKLEGEQEYKRTMTDAANAIKVLNSEQKLAAAEFENSGDAQQYAATQARILKEQIANQKKAVAAAEAAIKDLTNGGVDPNSKAMQTWKTKLNNSKAALLQMETRLGTVEGELGDQTTALGTATDAGGEYKDQLDKIGKGFDINNTITAIDSITDKIAGAAKAAARAAKAIWDMGADAGAWADDLLTTASQMGVDVETLQSWQYASRFIDTSVDDISRSWQDLTKRIKDGDTTYLAALAEMGVASMNADGTMRESQDIFWDMIDALHNMEDPQARAAAATKMFGNDWRNLNPLIEEGSQAYKDLAAEGADVAVVSEDNVKALGAADDAMQKMQASFDKMKLDALAALAPTFEKVANSLSTAITALDQFIQTEEGQQMLSSLNEALSGIIDSIVGKNGEGFSKIVDTAKGAVEGLTGALDWISKNGDTVAGILGTIAAAFAGLKVSSTVLQFVKLANGMKGIFGVGASSAADSVAATAASVAEGSAASGVGVGLLGSVGAAMIPVAVVAAGVLPGIIAGAVAAANTKTAVEAAKAKADAARANAQQGVETAQAEVAAAEASGDKERAAAAHHALLQAQALADETEALASIAELGDSLTAGHEEGNGALADPKLVAEAAKEAEKILDESGARVSGKTRSLIHRAATEAGMSAGEMTQLVEDAMNEAADTALTLTAKEERSITSVLSDSMDALIDAKDALDDGGMTVDNISGIYAAIDQLSGAPEVFNALSDSTKEALGAFYDIESGRNGFSDALELIDAMLADMDAAYKAAYSTTKGDGANVAEGLAEGISESAGVAEGEAAAMAEGVTESAESALGIKSPSRVFEGIGQNVAYGLANGIYSGGSAAISAALWLARSVENIVRTALQIHSPSAVFADLGDFVGEGFAEGISGSARTVERAVDTMLNATTKRPIMAVGGYSVSPVTGTRTGTGNGAPGDPADMVNVTLVLDEEVLGSVMAPIVNDKIGAKIQATRR